MKLTGNKINTPRGTFREARGLSVDFTLWFEHEDHYIMSDGISAFAVKK